MPRTPFVPEKAITVIAPSRSLPSLPMSLHTTRQNQAEIRTLMLDTIVLLDRLAAILSLALMVEEHTLDR